MYSPRVGSASGVWETTPVPIWGSLQAKGPTGVSSPKIPEKALPPTPTPSPRYCWNLGTQGQQEHLFSFVASGQSLVPEKNPYLVELYCYAGQ